MHDLESSFLHVAQDAAIAAARTVGFGDRHHSDQVAVEAMRAVMDTVEMQGRIVIGEGERDEAPMLYIGEEVGNPGRRGAEVDIAVDPLEGTNLCATGAPNAIAVIAAAPRGGLLHAPDVYLEKLVVGPQARGAVHIEATVDENLKAIARCLDRAVSDLLVVVLDRPRHEQLIADLRRAGARIRLIGDGDLAPGVAAALQGTGVHAVMGAGGAPEGVLTAAAMRCIGGEIQGRLMPAKPGDVERLRKAGYTDLKKVFKTEDLAPSDDVVFCASGVTDGALLRGVHFFGGGCRTQSLVMRSKSPRHIRFVDQIHLDDGYLGPIQSI
ncbi:MAG TPA: class II fructose-bisphosphatase [Planctomycetota bacterium]|nr:class II fructose-bisphosphatase [Planctomycetota bacterium]